MSTAPEPKRLTSIVAVYIVRVTLREPAPDEARSGPDMPPTIHKLADVVQDAIEDRYAFEAHVSAERTDR